MTTKPWQQRIVEASETRNVGLRSVKTQLTDEATLLVRRAAASRGISLSAYMRRAMLAFAAHDLGLDYYAVLDGEAPVREYNAPGRSKAHEHAGLDGRGFGPWVIGELGE